MLCLTKSSLRSAVIAVVLLCSALALAVPPRSRTVKKFSWPDSPVEIIAVMVKGKPVEFGKAFPEGNKWPRLTSTSATRNRWPDSLLKKTEHEHCPC